MAAITLAESLETVWTAPTEQAQVDSSDSQWWDATYGSNMALSADGTVLAVTSADYYDLGTTGGAPLEDRLGRVFVYDVGVEGALTERDSYIARTEFYGTGTDFVNFGGQPSTDSLCLSSDGSKLVVGAYGWGGGNFGRIFTYTWGGASYTEVGTAVIPYPTVTEWDDVPFLWGAYTAMSADGLVLAVGMYNTYYDDFPTLDYLGLIRIYDWNGGTSAWDFRETLNLGNENYDRFGKRLSLNSDGSYLIATTHSTLDVYFYEDTGSGFTSIGHSILWAADAPFDPGYFEDINPIAADDTFWARADGDWRQFTLQGTVWVQGDAVLPIQSPYLFAEPAVATADNELFFVGDVAYQPDPPNSSNYNGAVYTTSLTSEVASTCYTKSPEPGIIDYVCVEYPAPPNLPTPPDTNLPTPPAYDSTPNEPAPFLDCSELEAAYFAAVNLSSNPEYSEYVDQQYANGTQLDSSNGSQICKFI